MKRARMNFVFFMPESLRADAVGCLGNTLVDTPNMNKIAEEGVSFTNCFAQHSVCTPSRCSMFTGLYPHTAGHRTLFYLLQAHESNLFRNLKENGYYTQCFGKNDLLAQDAISFSFDSVGPKDLEFESPFPENPWPEGHKLRKSFYYGRRSGRMSRDFDWACIEGACDFLDRPPSEPFCLYLPLIFVHPPYTVEEPYFSKYERWKMPTPSPANFTNKRRFMRLLHEAHGIDRLGEEDKREIRAVYLGMVTRVDEQLGIILEKLKDTGRYDNTGVFIFSDHGDYTGDYGLVEKWWTGFQDCLLNVPFIARIPGFGPVGAKDMMIEMIDLYPTVLELAGIDPPHSHFGKSLIRLLREQESHFREAVFAEGGHLRTERHCFEPITEGIYYEKTILPRKHGGKVFAKAVMVRTGKFKYIYCPDDINELYDLKGDPQELHNLTGKPEVRSIEQTLRDEILPWLVRTGDSVPYKWDQRKF